MSGWTVLYMRPDGWWLAGSGFESEEEANRAAAEQLPDHVSWCVVEDDSMDAITARVREGREDRLRDARESFR